MKNILTLIICFVISNSIFGQENFQYSEPFKEPEGWTKLIQIRNGNTALIEITKRDGMFLKLYGSDRKLITSGQIPLKVVGVKMGGPSSVPAIYDIGGDVVMFVLFWDKGEGGLVPTLIRVIIDGKTGSIKEESPIATLKELSVADNNEYAFGEKDLPTVYLEKDPESDNYAVITYNSFANDINTIINVMHYGTDHKMINTHHVPIPAGGFKYVNYLGAYVHRDEYVIVGAYAYNAGKGIAKDIKYFVSKIEENNSDVIQKDLKFQEYSRDAKGTFMYNPIKNNLTLVVTALNKMNGEEMGFGIAFQTINPQTLSIDNSFKDDLTKVNDYYKNKMNSKKDLYGFIGATNMSSNGNAIILYQNIGKRLISPTPGASGDVFNNHDYTNILVPVSKWTVQATYLGDIGLSVLSPEGKVIEGKAINFAMHRSGNVSEFGYNDARNGRKPKFEMQDPGLGAAWYFSLDMLTNENTTYIFCNAAKNNFDKPETERHDRTKSISSTSAVKYILKNGTITKDYLFGAPKDDKSNKFCNFTASDYNAATKTYCTIMVDVKEKKNYVVWFKLN